MNYELAKKLKDAGFEGIKLCEKGCFYNGKQHEPHTMQIPTLSELIEACEGIIIHVTTRMGSIAGKEGLPYSRYERGLTPEEAVANLWLQLNINKITAASPKGCIPNNLYPPEEKKSGSA